MSQLYLLSLLLTANPEKAEVCFAGALDDCVKMDGVFSEWGRSWARRAIIQNAISMAGDQLKRQRSGLRFGPPEASTTSATEPFAAVMNLSTFERFVFVMSVLERYSDQDCAVLLRCRRQQVVDGRLRALRHLAIMDKDRLISAALEPRHFVAEEFAY